jgi:hypothetical protein
MYLMVACTRDAHSVQRGSLLDAVIGPNQNGVHGERAIFSAREAVTINLIPNTLFILRIVSVEYLHLVGIERELGIQGCFEKQCRNRWKRRDGFAHWVIYHSQFCSRHNAAVLSAPEIPMSGASCHDSALASLQASEASEAASAAGLLQQYNFDEATLE